MSASRADIERAAGAGDGAERWRRAISLIAVVAMRPLRAVADVLFTAITPTLRLRTDHDGLATPRGCDPALWGKIRPEDIGFASDSGFERLPKLNDAEKCAACVANLATLAGLHTNGGLPSHGVTACDWTNLSDATPWEVAKAFGSNLGHGGRTGKKDKDDFPVDFFYNALLNCKPIAEVLTEAQRDAFYESLRELRHCRNGYVMHSKDNDIDVATLDRVRIAVERVLEELEKLLAAWKNAHAGIVTQSAIDDARAVVVEARGSLVAAMAASSLPNGEKDVAAIRTEIASVRFDLAVRAAESEAKDRENLVRVQSTWDSQAGRDIDDARAKLIEPGRFITATRDFLSRAGHEYAKFAGRQWVAERVAETNAPVVVIEGGMGTGKTTLASYLATPGTVDGFSAVAGFSFDQRNAATLSADAAVRTLVHQLASHDDEKVWRPYVEAAVYESGGHKGGDGPESSLGPKGLSQEGHAILNANVDAPLTCGATAAFSACIVEAARAVPGKRFLVVIDGLDEVGAESRDAQNDVAQLLRHALLCDEPGRKTLPENLRIVLLSRRPMILEALKKPVHVAQAEWINLGARGDEPDAEHCRADIRSFLVDGHGVREDVADAILARSGCHFQYAGLIAADAREIQSADQVMMQLPATLPVTLEDQYAQILSSVRASAPEDTPIVQSVLEVVVAASDVPRPLHRDECVGVVRLMRGITRIADDGRVRKVLDVLISSTLLEERWSGIQLLHASFREYLCADGSEVSIDRRMGHRALAGYALLAAETAARPAPESSDESSDESGADSGVDMAAWTRVVEWMVPLGDFGVRESAVVRSLQAFECGVRPLWVTSAAVSVHMESARRPAAGVIKKESFPTHLLTRLLSLSRDDVGVSLAELAGHGDLRLVKRYISAADAASVLTPADAEKALAMATRHIGVLEFFLKLDRWGVEYPSVVGLGRALESASLHGHLDAVTALLHAGADANATGQDGRTPMHIAAEHGRIDVVKALLVAGADTRSAMPDGRTPLHAASEHGHIDVVKALLVAGADPSSAMSDGRTPLHAASENGHLDVVKALLVAGADAKATGQDGRTYLYVASENGHLDAVKALLDAGADTNDAFKNGATSLHAASESGHLDVVKALLDAGADVRCAMSDRRTPLHAASENGHLEVVKALLDAGADANAVFKNGATSMHFAAEHGHIDVVKALLNAGADARSAMSDGRTPLHAASENGHLDVVSALLDAGADTNAEFKNGATSLHTASLNGHLDVVKALLDAGADAKCAMFGGRTPLQAASENGHLDVVIALLDAGADPKTVKCGDQTPLHVASQNGHLDVVKALLDAGADPSSAVSDGRTPLHVASENGHLDVVNALLAAGADVNAAAVFGKTPLHMSSENGFDDVMRALIEAGAAVNATLDDGWAPLHLASQGGHTEAINVLREAKADVNLCTAEGRTPLHAASPRGHVGAIEALLAEKDGTVAEVNAAAENGEMALHSASENGHAAAIAALVRAGANVAAALSDGWTSLHAASLNGHVSAINALVRAGADVDCRMMPDGVCPLHAASPGGHVGAINALLDAGADVCAATEVDGWTPLHLASQYGRVGAIKTLRARGADVNSAAKDGSTPLHVASQHAHVDAIYALVVDHLETPGAYVNVAANDGSTPLYTASRFGHVDAIEALVARDADVNSAANDGSTPVYAASQLGHVDAISALLDHGAGVESTARDGSTPLYAASRFGHVDAIGALLARGASVNSVANDGSTALYTASQYGHIDAIKALLDRGASVNTMTKNGETALYAAFQNQQTAAMEVLLAKGAVAPNAASTATISRLHAVPQNGHDEVIKALVHAGPGVVTPVVVPPSVVLMDEASTWTTIFSWLLFWENKEQQGWEIIEQNTGT
jgi:ankyrin repeat protein